MSKQVIAYFIIAHGPDEGEHEVVVEVPDDATIQHVKNWVLAGQPAAEHLDIQAISDADDYYTLDWEAGELVTMPEN